MLSRSSGTDNDNRLQVILVVACSFILENMDVVGTLTEQIDYEKARKYWNKLKQRLYLDL